MPLRKTKGEDRIRVTVVQRAASTGGSEYAPRGMTSEWRVNEQEGESCRDIGGEGH